MGELIEKLIENAHTIFNLYQKIESSVSTERREEYFQYLNICVQNESKLLEKISYCKVDLVDVIIAFQQCYGLEKMQCLDKYFYKRMHIIEHFGRLQFRNHSALYKCVKKRNSKTKIFTRKIKTNSL